MFLPKTSQKNTGFTLIELMVVISIIALLASILIAGLKSAKERALEAKSTQTIRAFQTALGLYYNEFGDWPSKAGDGRMSITTKTGQGWPQFYSMVQPYIPAGTPDVPYQEDGKFIISGIIYMKGTQTKPLTEPMWDGSTGKYIGCIMIYNGYFLDETFSFNQTNLTSKDNGFDPDSIDTHEGNVYIDPSIPVGSCPVPTIIF